jgi:hypothetical protein
MLALRQCMQDGTQQATDCFSQARTCFLNRLPPMCGPATPSRGAGGQGGGAGGAGNPLPRPGWFGQGGHDGRAGAGGHSGPWGAGGA